MSYKLGGVGNIFIDTLRILEERYYVSSITRETFLKELGRLGYEASDAKDMADEIDGIRENG